MYFVVFNYNGFSVKWWRFESHMRSTCWKLKSQCVSRLISRLGQLTRWLARCTNGWDFKCDCYTLHPYYIYSHYPQNCKEVVQKKTLKREMSTTPTLLERATHPQEWMVIYTFLLGFSSLNNKKNDIKIKIICSKTINNSHN